MDMDFSLDNLQYLMVLNQQTRVIDSEPKISDTGKSTRVYGGNDTYSDHSLVISKIALCTRWRKVMRKENERSTQRE
jgi:hypothetical protein